MATAKAAAASAKKTLSRGQAQLAKVNKSGMKPMSSFFTVVKKAKTESGSVSTSNGGLNEGQSNSTRKAVNDLLNFNS